MDSKWFSLALTLVACSAPTTSKHVEPTAAVEAYTAARSCSQNANESTGFLDGNHAIDASYHRGCITLREISSMTFISETAHPANKLECVNCATSNTPLDVCCDNKSNGRDGSPQWTCSTKFLRSGYTMTDFSLNCAFKDERKCYEPGICELRIWVGKKPSRTLAVALISVGVMTVFALLFLATRGCTRKAQAPAQSRRGEIRNLPMRREARSDHLQRNFQGADSPDVHRAFSIPARAPPPARSWHDPLDDPPPSYEQVCLSAFKGYEDQ